MVDFNDLNDAFGKALLQQFFEPVLTGRGINGEAYYAPSGVAIMAQELFKKHQALIMDEVWARIDMDELAGKVADKVVAELIQKPGIYQRNLRQEELQERVRNVVVQQLGQRAVDQMDIAISSKEDNPPIKE
jgi:hypothetical protein